MPKLTKSLFISRRSIGQGKLELSLGETEDSMEPVGIWQDHFYKNKYRMTSYKALNAQRLCSFHIRDDAYDPFIKPILPDETIILRAGDSVGWGTTYVRNQIICHPPKDNDPRSIN